MKHPLNKTISLFVLLLVFGVTGHAQSDTRPNILLLVADDLGYADLSCYGGDIDTPNIDSLAASGLRFSRFHAANSCAPTRAMLLSGNDNHIAGMGIQSYVSKFRGYEGRLTDRIVTIPQLLQSVGYRTYMAGKWHLGEALKDGPHNKGFEHSYVYVGGAANHYDDQGWRSSMPISQYTEDGQPVSWSDGDYSTDFYTDKLIEYIGRDHGDGKPFFAFAAYTSPHWPLQVDEPFWRKYEGRYDDGFEALKARRLESLKEAGMIPQDAVLPPNHQRVKPWDSLTQDEKKMEARKMELYAGMLDNLDHNIGRLLQYLKDIGEFENTFIVFMSDNGAAAEDFYYTNWSKEFVREHFHHDYERLGDPESFASYGPQWAEAGSAPFRYFKGQAMLGGFIAPMMVTGPGVVPQNEIFHGFATLMDLAPTFYELAGVEYPDSYDGKPVYPLRGASLMPLLARKRHFVHGPEYVFGFEQSERFLLRKGHWSLVNTKHPFTEENLGLYDLSSDLAQVHNLRESHPEKFQEMHAEWKRFAKEVGVFIPYPRTPKE